MDPLKEHERMSLQMVDGTHAFAASLQDSSNPHCRQIISERELNKHIGLTRVPVLQ